MNTTLKHILLQGTDFVVDTEIGELREVNDPWNTISFDEIVIDGCIAYLFYDPVIKNVFRGNYFTESELMKVIEIPVDILTHHSPASL